MGKETDNTPEIMVPLSLVDRLKWSQGLGKRLKGIRATANNGKRVSRRKLSESLSEQGYKYAERTIQYLEEGGIETIDVEGLTAILTCLGAGLHDLLDAKTKVALYQPEEK